MLEFLYYSSAFYVFFKKKSILRRSIKQQIKLIDTLKRECQSGDISATECTDIMQQWSEISSLLQKIAPSEPLTKKEWIIRGGVVFGLFFVLAIGVGIFIKSYYFPSGASIVENIDSSGATYKYIPEERAKISEPKRLNEISRSGRFVIDRYEEIEGTVVGIVSTEDSIVKILFTKKDASNSLCLYQATIDTHTRIKIDEKKMLDACEIIDASFVKNQSGYVLAYGADVEGLERLVIQNFDLNFDPIGVPIDVKRADDHEALIGLFLNKTASDEYLLVTTKLRAKDAAVSEKTAPIVRLFDSNLAVKRQEILETRSYTLEPYQSGFVLSNGGLHIFSNGRNPLVAGSADKGDELYLFAYDTDWKLSQIIQLTNNGRKHDFQPSDVLAVSENVYFVPGLQTEVPEAGIKNNAYPPETGQMFIRVLMDTINILGALNVETYTSELRLSERLEAGKNIHQFFNGKRLFVAHDAIIQRDPVDQGKGGDGEYREIRVEWFDLSFF